MRWQTAIRAVRSSAVSALLVLACLLAVQLSFLLAHVSEAICDLHQQASRAIAQAERSLAVIRETTERQRGSYDEIARNSARSLASLAQLIERTDERLESLTPAAEQLLRDASDATAAVSSQTSAVGAQAELLLGESRSAIAQIGELASNREFQQSAENLAHSTANLERMSAAAADSSERVREMLSPSKKSFWRRLLELMIPRPTIRVGK